MPKKWYILQFKPNAHSQAVKNLNQQNFKTFLPLHDTSSKNSSRFRSAIRPLFPGYMFISFDVEETGWEKINTTYGVSRLVTFNSKLPSVPSIIIDSLIMRCDFLGKLSPAKEFKKGNKVKLVKGPFINFIATIESYETDKRIWILIEFMGRQSKIQTSSDCIQVSG